MMSDYAAEETYTLADLKKWERKGVNLAVVGHPVRHSISPQMHNAALALLAQQETGFSNWKYFRFEIEPENLLQALPLFAAKGFLGLNLTVPHKEIAFHHIDQIDPSAKSIGAVNTLKLTPSGYRGYNTDGYGLSRGLQQSLKQAFCDSDVVMLGAGGAARAAAIQIIREKAKSLTIVNRNQDRLKTLIDELYPIAKSEGVSLSSNSPSEITTLPNRCILINATSLGLKESDPSPINEVWPLANLAFFDMIYNPPTTRAMKQVANAGSPTSNGLSMLVNQGARALEIWSERTVDVEAMQSAALNALETH